MEFDNKYEYSRIECSENNYIEYYWKPKPVYENWQVFFDWMQNKDQRHKDLFELFKREILENKNYISNISYLYNCGLDIFDYFQNGGIILKNYIEYISLNSEINLLIAHRKCECLNEYQLLYDICITQHVINNDKTFFLMSELEKTENHIYFIREDWSFFDDQNR